MSSVLRRSDVVRILARRCPLTTEQAEAVVNELFGSLTDKGALRVPGLIHEAIAHGITLKLRSFGEFDRRLWKGKRTPKAPSGTEATVTPDRYVPFFKPALPLRRAVKQVSPPENEGDAP